MNILFAFLVIAGLGLILGFGLAFADKKLAVTKEEKLVALEEIMPGANCGGCGFAGCAAYAEAVATNKAKVGLCSPGGAELASKMASIMGVEAVVTQKKVAHVFCSSCPQKNGKDYEYDGLSDCNAASILFKGFNTCKEGCIGLGSCIKVCPVGAIKRNEDKSLYVDRALCIGCGKCEAICPNKVIRLINESQPYTVDCNSIQKGAILRKYCETGCIGCSICQKKFPESGFVVENNLAKFTESNNLEASEGAMNACPRKVIKKV